MAYEFRIKNGVIINDTQPVDKVSTDVTLSGDANTTLVSEKAIKAYVDANTNIPTISEVLGEGNDAEDIGITNIPYVSGDGSYINLADTMTIQASDKVKIGADIGSADLEVDQDIVTINDGSPNVKRGKLQIKVETGSTGDLTITGTEAGTGPNGVGNADGVYTYTGATAGEMDDIYQRGSDAVYIGNVTAIWIITNDLTPGVWTDSEYFLNSLTPIGTYQPTGGSGNTALPIISEGGSVVGSNSIYTNGDIVFDGSLHAGNTAQIGDDQTLRPVAEQELITKKYLDGSTGGATLQSAYNNGSDITTNAINKGMVITPHDDFMGEAVLRIARDNGAPLFVADQANGVFLYGDSGGTQALEMNNTDVSLRSADKVKLNGDTGNDLYVNSVLMMEQDANASVFHNTLVQVGQAIVASNLAGNQSMNMSVHDTGGGTLSILGLPMNLLSENGTSYHRTTMEHDGEQFEFITDTYGVGGSDRQNELVITRDSQTLPNMTAVDINGEGDTQIATKGYVDTYGGGGGASVGILNGIDVADGNGGWIASDVGISTTGVITSIGCDNSLDISSAGIINVNIDNNDGGSDDFRVTKGLAGTSIIAKVDIDGKLTLPIVDQITNTPTAKEVITYEYAEANYAGGSESVGIIPGYFNTVDGTGGWQSTALYSNGNTHIQAQNQDLVIGATADRSVKFYIDQALHFIVRGDSTQPYYGVASVDYCSNDAIDAVGGKALITKEYAEIYYKGGGGGALKGSASQAAGTYQNGTVTTYTITVTGAVVGDVVAVSHSSDFVNTIMTAGSALQMIVGAYVSSANTVTLKLNASGAAVYVNAHEHYVAVL